MAVRVAGDKRFLLPFRGIHGALHRADIAAVDMNADGDAIRQRIADAMNIAIVSGDFLHLACFQKRGGAERARYAIGIQLVALVAQGLGLGLVPRAALASSPWRDEVAVLSLSDFQPAVSLWLIHAQYLANLQPPLTFFASKVVQQLTVSD